MLPLGLLRRQSTCGEGARQQCPAAPHLLVRLIFVGGVAPHFPKPDETTGLYCIEAVDRWRLRRHIPLFPELTAVPTAVDAGAVYQERLAALRRGSSS